MKKAMKETRSVNKLEHSLERIESLERKALLAFYFFLVLATFIVVMAFVNNPPY